MMRFGRRSQHLAKNRHNDLTWTINGVIPCQIFSFTGSHHLISDVAAHVEN
jgi:hypothetical protein